MIWGFIKKNVLLPAMAIFIFIITLLLFIKSPGNNIGKLDRLLFTKFDNKYISESRVVDNFIVSFIRSSFEPPHEGGTAFTQSELVKNGSPLLIVQSIKDKKLLNVYEIGIKNNSDTVKKDNFISLSESYFQTEKLKDFIVAAEWNAYYGGADGLKGLVLFSKKNNKIVPMTGYPKNPSKTNALVVTDKLTDRVYEFPVTSQSYFTSLTDLNNDNKIDLLYGRYIWSFPSESRYDYHNWILGLYELSGTRFEIPPWWNNGKEFVTDQKIDNIGNDQKLIQTFNDRIKISTKPVNAVIYLCENNKKIEISYLENMVYVVHDNKKYTLYIAPVASGELYKNEVGDELYSKANKLVFNKLVLCDKLHQL
ncbi:MliC family protein [Candidatus Poribacteria bacterium]|nr:MliC family protein [Candidatus Poribacteria bacterium]